MPESMLRLHRWVEQEDRDDRSAIGIRVNPGSAEITGVIQRGQINDDAGDRRASFNGALRDIAAGDVVLNILCAFVRIDGVITINELWMLASICVTLNSTGVVSVELTPGSGVAIEPASGVAAGPKEKEFVTS